MNWFRVHNLEPYLPHFELCQENRVFKNSGHALLTRMDLLSSNLCYVPENSKKYRYDERHNEWAVDRNTVPVLIHTRDTWLLFRPFDWTVWSRSGQRFWDLTPLVDRDRDQLIRQWRPEDPRGLENSEEDLTEYDLETSSYLSKEWNPENNSEIVSKSLRDASASEGFSKSN